MKCDGLFSGERTGVKLRMKPKKKREREKKPAKGLTVANISRGMKLTEWGGSRLVAEQVFGDSSWSSLTIV